MDQSAFRSLISAPRSSSSSSNVGALGGAGPKKRTSNPFANIPNSKQSIDQFKPRAQSQLDKGKNKAKEKEDGKLAESEGEDGESTKPFRRFGYADRASMRRAGLGGTEMEEGQDVSERQPRGQVEWTIGCLIRS